MKLVFFLFFLILSVAVSGQAAWVDDFELLKQVPRSYEDPGAICEEVGRIQLQREYPAPAYSVITGIAYGNERQVIGELDIVVFDNNLQKVIKIGEVKCWKDMAAGLQKAQEQRARFLKFVRSSKPLRLFNTSTKETYVHDQFRYVSDFFSLGQKGAIEVGFDRELDYTLQEMHQRRYDMISCQRQKDCVRP